MNTVQISITRDDGDIESKSILNASPHYFYQNRGHVINLMTDALQHLVFRFTVTQFYTVLNGFTVIEIDRLLDDNYAITVRMPEHKVSKFHAFMGKHPFIMQLCGFTETSNGITIESVELKTVTDSFIFMVLHDFEQFDTMETVCHYTSSHFDYAG